MKRILVAAFTVAILLSGCATANLKTCEQRAAGDQQQIRGCRLSAAFHQLEALNSDYEGILIASGNARRLGFIDDSKLEEIRKAGREAQRALETAREALAAAVRANSDPRGLVVGASVLLADLARLAVTLGVKSSDFKFDLKTLSLAVEFAKAGHAMFMAHRKANNIPLDDPITEEQVRAMPIRNADDLIDQGLRGTDG